MSNSLSHDLVLGVVVLGAIPVFGLLVLFIRVHIRAGREEPVLELIETFPWQAGWDERAYQRQLGGHLQERLGSWQKLDAPIITGTRVDLVLRRTKAEFHVTMKLGLDNQQRLTIMGEIEDIIADCRGRKGNEATIVVVVGYRATDVPTNVAFQIAALEAHIATRQKGLLLDRGERDFDFRVVRRQVGFTAAGSDAEP